MPAQNFLDLRTNQEISIENIISTKQTPSDKYITISPHSGTLVPSICLENIQDEGLINDTDQHSDKIFDLQKYQSTVISYLIHRGIIDVNRNKQSKKTQQSEDGIFRTHRFNGEIIIKKTYDPQLEAELIKMYDQFLGYVTKQVDDFRKQYGEAIIINGHSMTDIPSEKRPGFCIANDYGAASDPRLFDLLNQSLNDILKDHNRIRDKIKQFPSKIQAHHPFKGYKGLTCRLGKPQENKHCILIEVNQGLYMTPDLQTADESMITDINRFLGTALKETVNSYLQPSKQ